MKITGLETFQIPQFPLSLFLRVHTDEGLVGLGESTNQPDAIEGAVHGFLAPRVLGREAEDIEAFGTSCMPPPTTREAPARSCGP